MIEEARQNVGGDHLQFLLLLILRLGIAFQVEETDRHGLREGIVDYRLGIGAKCLPNSHPSAPVSNHERLCRSVLIQLKTLQHQLLLNPLEGAP